MILKGMKSLELEKYFSETRASILELEEKMHRFGHTDFQYHCKHGLTQMVVDPDGPIPKEVCLGCGKEIVR